MALLSGQQPGNKKTAGTRVTSSKRGTRVPVPQLSSLNSFYEIRFEHSRPCNVGDGVETHDIETSSE